MGFRILLIEDNPADAGLVRKALEQHQVTCELLVVPDGEAAFDFVEQLEAEAGASPDLVIIDLNLPKRSGREVLQRFRQSSNCSVVPIVILSSSDAQQDRADATLLGASRYLRKPSRLKDFLNLGAIFKTILTDRAS